MRHRTAYESPASPEPPRPRPRARKVSAPVQDRRSRNAIHGRPKRPWKANHHDLSSRSIGNDREIANVTEIWSNTELGLMILQDRSDPRAGETVTKLENISRTQPDPTLFQPPADYKILDVAAER